MMVVVVNSAATRRRKEEMNFEDGWFSLHFNNFEYIVVDVNTDEHLRVSCPAADGNGQPNLLGINRRVDGCVENLRHRRGQRHQTPILHQRSRCIWVNVIRFVVIVAPCFGSKKSFQMYSVTSFGAKIDDMINKGKGYDANMKLIDVAGTASGKDKRLLDALAIYRVHGNPSFFITFTCNVKWPEIKKYMESFLELTGIGYSLKRA
ncbi:DNA helicase [Tanacetum coccineum]